ncbi:MAG: hypothetical protein AABX02_00820 [archaeon]
MSIQTIGLVFLLLGVGFFLSWGYTDETVNFTMDFILGAILVVIGFGMMRYSNPFIKESKRVLDAAQNILEGADLEMFSAKETRKQVHQIQSDARHARQAIVEQARTRIDKITQSTKGNTSETFE